MRPEETPKLNCEITRDLLPLYEENLASPGTRAAVEEHLAGCAACRALHTRLADPEPTASSAPEAAREVDYLKKVRKASRLQVAAAVAVTLVLLVAGAAFKIFWLGSPATREGVSWSAQWTDEGNVLQLRVYTASSGTAYREWNTTQKDGVITITARKVLASALCRDSSERFALDLTDVDEVYLFGTLLWQNGVTIFETNLRQYEQRTPYVGSGSEVGQQLQALYVADVCGPFTIALQTAQQPYGLQLNFTNEYTAEEAKKLNEQMAGFAPRLLALIENLDYVCWHWTNGTSEFVQRVSRQDASAALDEAMTRLVAAGEFDDAPFIWQDEPQKQWPGHGIKWCGQSAAGYQILCDLINGEELAIVPELVAAESWPEVVPQPGVVVDDPNTQMAVPAP